MEQGQAVFLSWFCFAGINLTGKKETMEFMESEYGSVVFFSTETVREQYMARKTNFKILS